MGTTALRHLVRFGNGSDFKSVEAADGPYPVYGSGGEFARSTAYLHDGESVLFGRKGTVDRPLYVNGRFWTVDTMYYTVPGPRVEPRFLYYWATTIPFDLYSTSTALPSMTSGTLGSLQFPLIGRAQQRRIADYLDRETAAIDALIEKQRELVRHLQERRVAFRERLVDEVCAHVTPIAYRRVVAGIRQGWSPQCNNWPAPANVWRVLKVGCVNHGVFRSNENKELPGNLDPRPETVVRAGELVVSRANTRELVGSAAAVTEEHPRLMLSDKLYAITHSTRANSEFMALVLGTARYRELMELEATGASPSMQNISQDVLLSLPVRLPEVRVQEEAVERWDRETAKIATLIAKAERFIQLAQERRAALITAAVTGQIETTSE